MLRRDRAQTSSCVTDTPSVEVEARWCSDLKVCPHLTLEVEARSRADLKVSQTHLEYLPGSVQSTLNNSATRTSLAMILDAYESPSPRLSHAVSIVSRFEVPLAQWNYGLWSGANRVQFLGGSNSWAALLPARTSQQTFPHGVPR